MKIFIKIKVRSKNNTIKKIDDNHYLVSITEVPEKGKANKALVKILAKSFNVPLQAVEIISGLSSRNKIVEIKEI